MKKTQKKTGKPKTAPTNLVTGKHSGTVARPFKVSALEVTQGAETLYMFKAKASVIYGALSISRRTDNKDEGYQRALSLSRIQAIMRYIVSSKQVIPGAIIVCLDSATFDRGKGILTIPAGTDVGWVIDGQHRLAGAYEASKQGVDIDLSVVAFHGLSKEKQIQQFITINKEAKNVPTSLYLDLLRQLPPSANLTEIAKERASDLGSLLRRDETSPFYEKITVVVSPKPGQVSLTNFARKIAPLVMPEKGLLSMFTEREQRAIINNYYKGMQQVYPDEFSGKDSIFFKTVGFGALWNAFPVFFNLALTHQQGFEVKDVVAILRRANAIDFSAWNQLGTGNKAETQAGEDLKTQLMFTFREGGSQSGSIRV